MAYLAIPGILDTPGEITLGVVASLISIVMSLCSVILGLLLTKRLRGLDEKGASEAVCPAFLVCLSFSTGILSRFIRQGILTGGGTISKACSSSL